MSWTRALHFKSWADTQDARHTLPLLIRRLVRGFVPANALVAFPAIEQVQRPGFDGIVEVTTGNQFVPTGKSCWEMGVGVGIERKADDDFEKRSKDTPVEVQRQTTFVFVTPREWRTKDEWAEDKKRNSEWQTVTVLDANDLEHWIELCPAVDLWFATTSGRRPNGLIDLSARWFALSKIGACTLTPRLFLCSRDHTCTELLTWLDREPNSLLLKCDSAEDGLDFLSALCASNLKDSAHLQRMFVVNDIDPWRALATSREALILVASASLTLGADDISEAVANGHHALILASRTASLQSTTLRLPRQESSCITTELHDCGYDDSKARSLALACCGSSAVLKRLLTLHPQTAFPEWSIDDHRASLAPFALLGGWMHVDPEPTEEGFLPRNIPIDLLCIEDFMEISRQSLEAAVARWCGTDDPFFLRFGTHVVVASREDAWYLLGAGVTPQMLGRFESLASLVLEEDNPALDLESKDRWMANIYGKTHSLSGELREGILETLVLMAVYPTAGIPAFEVDYRAIVRRVLETALPEGASWKRWATFDRQLRLFAEADPEFLLSRIESDLASRSPQLPLLFENTGSGLFSSPLHCGLLWALETMAWSPALLGRVTSILGRLVEIERALPANLGNRPSKTLNGIYLWWLPHTNATVDGRIAELRRLIDNYSTVGWSLLVDMLPDRGSSICGPTEMPRWRDWAVGWSREKMQREVPDYALRIATLAVDTAAESAARWAELIPGIFSFSAEMTERALQRLRKLSVTCDDVGGRSDLWKHLRNLISQHEAFSDSDWALDGELLKQLSAVRDELEPDDPVALNEWLFDHQPVLPDADVITDYDRYMRELESRRNTALREITSNQGWDGVARLISTVPDVATAGWLVGRKGYLGPEDIGLWDLFKASERQFAFAASYSCGAFGVGGFQFLEDVKIAEQPPDQAAKVICSVPFERRTWDWVDRNLGETFSDAYWQQCRGFVRSADNDDVRFAVERLLQARRPFTAADVLHMAFGRTPVDMEQIYSVLEAGLTTERNGETIERFDSYATQQLIKHLQANSVDQLPRLGRIEWGYLPVLDKRRSQVEPKTLMNELQTVPSSFVELLKVIFRGANEEPREEPLTDIEQSQYHLAHDLLDAFCNIPGSDPTGAIDESGLLEWTNEVRSLARSVDRLGVADLELGRLFSRCPKPAETDWPPLPICRIMEAIASDEVFAGFVTGLMRSRGVVCRSPTSGGGLERQLATRYRELAAHHQTNFPRLAASFRNLAEHYDRDAEREDEDTERRRLER